MKLSQKRGVTFSYHHRDITQSANDLQEFVPWVSPARLPYLLGGGGGGMEPERKTAGFSQSLKKTRPRPPCSFCSKYINNNVNNSVCEQALIIHLFVDCLSA